MKKITKEMTLGEIVEKYPQANEVFFKYGLHCIGCHIAPSETLEQGAAMHGVAGDDFDKFVIELNEVVK